jgi:hypothetical protein
VIYRNTIIFFAEFFRSFREKKDRLVNSTIRENWIPRSKPWNDDLRRITIIRKGGIAGMMLLQTA